MKARRIPHLTVISLLLLALAGCATPAIFQPKMDNSVFYFLDSKLTDDQVAEMSHEGPAVLIGPSSTAKFLDQPQIVTFEGTNSLKYSDTHRWGEPLVENVDRMLLDQIALGLGTSRGGIQRILGDFEWDYRVGYHIYQLGGGLGDQVELQVAWWVTSKNGEEPDFVASRYIAKVQAGAGEYAAYVEAIKDVVITWGAEVAQAIDSMQEG